MQATSRTEVSLNPGSVAFGNVPAGAKANQSITVKYGGRGRDWKLTEIAPVQGPFEVKVTEVSRGGPLRGGVEYQVDFTLKPNAPPGPITEQVSIRTNDSTYPVLQIPVSGAVAAPLELAPNKVRFDGAKVGEPVSTRVLIRAAKPFKVLGVDNLDEGITVDLPAAGAPLPVQFITVKFDPKAAGEVTRTLRIRTDLDGGMATLPVEATVVAK